MTPPRVTVPVDTFNGDNAALVASISALLEAPDASLSARVPGMAKQLLASAAARLSAAPAPEGGVDVPSSWSTRYQGIATREEASAEACVSHKAEGIALDPCCPTCEAPAEAGERDVIAREDWIGFTGNQNAWDRAKDTDNETAKYCWATADRILALRAQPQAHSGEVQ